MEVNSLFYLYLTVQVKSKLGFIFLQSCDGCKSHKHIIDLAERLIFSISLGFLLQGPPPSPNTPEEYQGIFAATVAGKQVGMELGKLYTPELEA